MRSFLKILHRVLIPRRDKRNYRKYKEEARDIVHQKVREWNTYYNLPVKKIYIKNQKTRWGSCSSKGNLNFNYRIVYLPPPLQDYLIVHELCHLKEFNHSRAFWALVSETIPHYSRLRSELKKYQA